MHLLLTFVVAAVAAQALYPLSQWAFAAAAGLRPSTVVLFAGPRILSLTVGGTELRVGCLPVASRMEFGLPETDTNATPELARQYREFAAKPFWLQAALHAVGPCALVTAAAVALGPARAVGSLGHGFVQLVQGAWAPLRVGAGLVEGFSRLVAAQGALVGGAVLFVKLAALNLLPLPNTAGGMILTLPLARREPPVPALIYAQWIGVLIVLEIWVAWALAIWEAVR